MNVILSTVHLLLPYCCMKHPCSFRVYVYMYMNIVYIYIYIYTENILEYIECDLVQIIPDQKTRSII